MLFERAKHVQEAAFGADNPRLASVLQNLCELLRTRFHDLAGAKALAVRVLALRKKEQGENHALVAESYRTLGLIAADSGNRREARAQLARSVAISRRVKSELQLAYSLEALGGVELSDKRYSVAAAAFAEAAPLCRRLQGHFELVGNSLFGLAQALLGKGPLTAAARKRVLALAGEARRAFGSRPGLAASVAKVDALIQRLR